MDNSTIVIYAMSFRQDKQSWKKSGIFSREVKMLSDMGRITHLFSGNFSQKTSEKIEGNIIYVCCVWEMLKLLITARKIVLITNQDSSLIYALPMYFLTFYKTKLIFRSGYNQVDFFLRRKKILKAVVMWILVLFGNLCCSLRIVSNEIEAEKIKKSINKVTVIPNSEVVLDRGTGTHFIMIHVGRRSDQKRSDIVYKVLNNYPSAIITNTENIKDFKEKIFTNIPNVEVLNLMRFSEYFLLISKFEGSPKALIEAIAMGCIPIVSIEVIHSLPTKLQKYFTPPLFDETFKVTNLKNIRKQYSIGKHQVQHYFSRQRSIKLWQNSIDYVASS